MSDQSPWMTVAQACLYAQVGKKSLYRALRTGELSATQGAVRPGTVRGTWRIHRDNIDAWLRGAHPEDLAPIKLSRVVPQRRVS